jgi:hypothetical protein
MLLSRLERAEAWFIHSHVVGAHPAHQRLLAVSNVGHQLLHQQWCHVGGFAYEGWSADVKDKGGFEKSIPSKW